MPKQSNSPLKSKPTKSDLALRERAAMMLNGRQCAASLYEFFLAAWAVLNPDIPLSPSWHYEYLCEVLQYAVSGQMKADHPEWRGVIINVPPRTLKSFIVNIVLPCWVWASRSEKKFLCISYGQELAVNEIASKRRKLLVSDWYDKRYPKVQIVEDVNLKHRWDSEAGGYMIATTPGGFASGSGANYIIVDDVIKLDDAYTTQRENANKYYENELYSRLNNQATDFFIVICQRLHESDLPGYLNKNEAGLWWNIVMPLECEQDTSYDYPITGRQHIRIKGDVLLPDRFPPHVIAALKKSSIRWAGQYQQTPMPATGNLCDPSWWMIYEELPQFDLVTLSVDASFKGTQSSDYCALEIWGHVRERNYLLDVRNEKMDAVQLESAILDMIANSEAQINVLLIEEAANGRAVIDRLKRQNLPVTIVPVTPEGGKLSRSMAAQPEVEAGNCYLPKTAKWLQEFKNQLALGVDVAANDDLIDAWSQAITWRRNHRYAFFEALASLDDKPKVQAKPVLTQEERKKERLSDQKQMVRDEFRSRLRTASRRGQF